MVQRIRIRHDTTAGWIVADRILAPGEPGLDIDTGALRVGDGVQRWSELPLVGGGTIDGDLAHVHTQAVASASWMISHSLGRLPAVALYIGGEQVDADVTASSSSVTISLPTPMTGTAVLN